MELSAICLYISKGQFHDCIEGPILTHRIPRAQPFWVPSFQQEWLILNILVEILFKSLALRVWLVDEICLY